jgi:hypothetical protein
MQPPDDLAVWRPALRGVGVHVPFRGRASEWRACNELAQPSGRIRKNLQNLVLRFASRRHLPYVLGYVGCPISRSAEVPAAEECEIKETVP